MSTPPFNLGPPQPLPTLALTAGSYSDLVAAVMGNIGTPADGFDALYAEAQGYSDGLQADMQQPPASTWPPDLSTLDALIAQMQGLLVTVEATSAAEAADAASMGALAVGLGVWGALDDILPTVAGMIQSALSTFQQGGATDYEQLYEEDQDSIQALESEVDALNYEIGFLTDN